MAKTVVKPYVRCPKCRVKIYFETTKANLAFYCAKCNCHMKFKVPEDCRSEFHLPKDPILTYAPEAEKQPPRPTPEPPKPPQPLPLTSVGNVYIKINATEEPEIRKQLQMYWPELLVDCPSAEGAVEYVIRNVFPERLQTNYVITNNAHYIEPDHVEKNVSIRSVTSNFLQSRLYDVECQLRISGKINSKGMLDVRRLDIVRPTPLVFNEQPVRCRVIYDAKYAPDNWLNEIVTSTPSYSGEMQTELSHWSDYLDWKQKLAELKIRSAKYIGVRLKSDDFGPTGLSFLAVAPDKATYDQFRKALKKEADNIAIVSNSSSKDRWSFSYQATAAKSERDIILPFEAISSNPAPDQQWEEVLQHLRKGQYQTLSLLEARALIRREFTQFPAPVFFEITFGFDTNTSDALRRIDSVEDKHKCLTKQLLSKICPDGFICTSRVGDFTLNTRLKRAVNDLSKGHSLSGNLGNWIFDITKARVSTHSMPDLEWSPWGKDHLNNAQKRIVQEMLMAPDVYLCQGPPGTGKTTVISEIVYQLAIRNKRVLIASQTNLAVNNALSRLIGYPNIRAIRLGAEHKLDESVGAISEQNILRTFFTQVGASVNKNYLSKWDTQDQLTDAFQRKLDAVKQLTQAYSDADLQCQKMQAKINDTEQAIAAALSRIEADYEAVERQKDQAMRLSFYVDHLEQRHIPKDPPFLDAEQHAQLYVLLRETITAFAAKEYTLLPEYTDLQTGFASLSRKEANYAIHDMARFFLFVCSCKNMGEPGTADSKTTQLLRNLQVELRELEELDDVSFEDYQKIQSIKKQIKKLQECGLDTFFPSDLLSFLPAEVRASRKDTPFTHTMGKALAEDIGSLSEKGIRILVDFYKDYVKKVQMQSTQEDEVLQDLRRQRQTLCTQLEHAKALRDHVLSQQDTLATQLGHPFQELTGVLQDSIQQLEKVYDLGISRPDFEPFLREFISHIEGLDETYELEKSEYLNDFINACNVVGISCTESSYTLTEAGFKTFDVAIIDEVSKATPPELLIPLLMAEKAILVGDHRQLPPIFGEQDTSYHEYIQNIAEDDLETKSLLTMSNYERFEDLVTNSLFKRHYEQAAPSNKGALLEQYRMHREIMNVVNMFYDGKLIAGYNTEEESWRKSHHAVIKSHQGGVPLVTPAHHAYWIDSSSLHGRGAYEAQAKGSSKFNRLEAVLIANMVQQINDSYRASGHEEQVEVGIISFYSAQVTEIRKEISKKCNLTHVVCDVNTVDRFQGKEKPIVIVSLVRNVMPGRRYDASFVKTYQRINVAVSRAQNLLLLVGAKDMYIDQQIPMEDMETGKPSGEQFVYRNIIEDLHMNGCFLTADDILSQSASADVFDY